MSSKSKRLGTLADVFQAEKLEGTIRKIRMEKIHPSEFQPRQERKKSVEELASSLEKDGLLQPLVVTKTNNEEVYKIVAGERRFHAASLLGWTEIECKILAKDERETFRLAVIENLQREDLSPYEEVEAMAHLKTTFGYSDSQLAEMFGKSRNYMNELLSISALPQEDLSLCKEAGIQSKNLLVQAALASKKGSLREFLQVFQSGSVSTVKQAKEFNKHQSEKKHTKVPDFTPHSEQLLPDYEVSKKGQQVIIKSDDPALLNNIYKYLKKELKKKF